MKRSLCLVLALIMCLSLISCGEKHVEEEKNDAPVYEDTDDNLPTIRDPDGTPTMPADKNRILIDHTVKHTDLSADEKLEILNDLKNKDFISAFMVLWAQGWVSVEVSEDDQMEAYEELVNFFASPEVVYEPFQGDASMLHEYVAYVTLTDSDGNEYTLFVQDTSIYHGDEIIGEFSDGSPMYAYTECAAICYDGDWFIIRDTLGWWPLTRIKLNYSGYYN